MAQRIQPNDEDERDNQEGSGEGNDSESNGEGTKPVSKRGAAVQSKSAPLSDGQSIKEVTEYMDERVRETKKALEKQPRVMFHIPVTPGDSADVYEVVNINGYRLEIKRGVMVSLPQQVYGMLAEKYRVESTAGMNKRLDHASKETLDALS